MEIARVRYTLWHDVQADPNQHLHMRPIIMQAPGQLRAHTHTITVDSKSKDPPRSQGQEVLRVDQANAFSAPDVGSN